MVVAAVSLRNFRSHRRFDLDLGEALTLLAGPNGCGKTNVLEAIHFGLTGRSCRTSSDRQVISHGESSARVEVTVTADGTRRVIGAALDRDGERRLTVDGTPVERSDAGFERPLAIVFLPDRLGLITGAPGGRRAHLDQLLAALRPSMAGLRSDYGKALMQRNALLASSRRSGSLSSSIDAWDSEVARVGSALVRARDDVVESLAGTIAGISSELGLSGSLSLSHRPGGEADEAEFEAKLAADRQADLERGYTLHGPHRGDLIFRRDGHEVKSHASQGEKRLVLLSLLLAEREAIAQARGTVPLILLDDVMSELDSTRRGLLAARVAAGGQCVITATEAEHVPGLAEANVKVVEMDSDRPAGLRAA